MPQRNDITLPGSAKGELPMRPCSKCGHDKPPEGGIQMSPARWVCAGCWRLFNSRKK